MQTAFESDMTFEDENGAKHYVETVEDEDIITVDPIEEQPIEEAAPENNVESALFGE